MQFTLPYLNKNTPSMHHPRRRNVTSSKVGLKNGHTRKILTENCEAKRYSWATQKKKNDEPQRYSWATQKKKNDEPQRYSWATQKKKNDEPQRYSWATQKKKNDEPQRYSWATQKKKNDEPQRYSWATQKKKTTHSSQARLIQFSHHLQHYQWNHTLLYYPDYTISWKKERKKSSATTIQLK